MSLAPPARNALILFLFFFSGAVGVAYEVIWARQLSLLFGVSIYAVSAVLVAFMGGLGAGAEYFGRKLDAGTSPMRLYSLLETGLGVYVLGFPLVLSAVEKVYLLLHPGYEGVSGYVIFLRLALSSVALAVPTVLMGGTLPAMARYFAESAASKRTGRLAGALYAVNTLGAMAGCVVTGFWMVENFGLTNSLRAGACINILIGGTVWALAAEPGWRLEPAPRKAAGGDGRKWDTTLLILFGLSGFSALALEVLWTRLLILLLNNTTYAFSLILATFLLGIGAGSAVASRFTSGRLAASGALFAMFQTGVGLFAMISLAGFAYNQPLMDFIGVFVKDNGWLAGLVPGGAPMAVAVIFSVMVVFPATFLMGGGFPLIVEAMGFGRDRLGGEVGRFYAVNIIGCVLGSVLAGYALIPMAGVQKSVLLVSWVSILSGSLFLFTRFPGLRGAVVVLVAGVLAPLTAAVAYKGDTAYLLSAQKLDRGSDVLFYEEGPSATVLVSSQETDLSAGRKPVKRIWINGDPIAGVFREALQLERLQAHIPLLLHENPKDALVICFGTGSTAGAAAAHGLDSVTAVDISREVFDAGEEFSDGNMNVLNSPILRLVEEDGRNFLMTTNRSFDFITSEPPPPSNAGIVSLYTREFYELCKRRLRKGGIVSQWIPLHHLSESDFKSLVASFVDVFSHVSVWYTKWDAIMIGSMAPVKIDVRRIEEGMKNPAVAASLKEIGVANAFHLVSNYMMSKERALEFVGDVAPLSDDMPVVEFTAPRVHARGVTIKGANLTELLEYRTLPAIEPVSAMETFEKYFKSESLFLRGQVERNNGDRRKAAEYYTRALRVNDDNPDARYALLSLNLSTLYSAMSGGGRPELGLMMLDDTRKLDTDRLFAAQTHFLRGMFLARANRLGAAERELRRAIDVDDEYLMAMVNLAGLYGFKLNKPDKARELYNRALTLKVSEIERESILGALGKLEGSGV